jgi:cell fate regulator YaaT (PSP1 superfamily)
VLVVQIQVPGRMRAVSCETDIRDLELGDRLLAEVDGRTRFGSVSRVPLELPWKAGVPIGRVLRRANRRDEEQESHLERRREECLEAARTRAEELALEMRFLRAETTPSGRKVTLLFVAEGRVDFRQLARDLARSLRARVELRQIGVRDAAALQGGMGHCGRPLCCGTWLPGFAPVSMKMAKAQGLPLNPQKISGQCGRLMCCLRYEMDGSARKRPEQDSPCGGCGGAAPPERPGPAEG